ARVETMSRQFGFSDDSAEAVEQFQGADEGFDAADLVGQGEQDLQVGRGQSATRRNADRSGRLGSGAGGTRLTVAGGTSQVAESLALRRDVVGLELMAGILRLELFGQLGVTDVGILGDR